MLRGERRTDARRTALAFQRLDQRGLLAADVGARADVDVDVEIEALMPLDGFAEQPLAPTAIQHCAQGI
jgi:hypothetical protein